MEAAERVCTAAVIQSYILLHGCPEGSKGEERHIENRETYRWRYLTIFVERRRKYK